MTEMLADISGRLVSSVRYQLKARKTVILRLHHIICIHMQIGDSHDRMVDLLRVE